MQHPSTCSCSRRSFLRGSGMTLAGFGIASLFPTPFINQVMAQQTDADRRLLFIFLRGGNDGLNAVIPHGDLAYAPAIRPDLYIAPNEAIDLNGFASLHPSLGDMTELYDAGDLAVIHRVGYANSSRSHFDGQRIWENGDPTQAQLFEGWLYRYVQDNAVSMGVDLPVLSVQATQPILLQGEEKFVNIANPNSFDYVVGDPIGAKLQSTWRGVYENLVGLEPYRPVLSQTGVKLVDTLDEYENWDQGNWNPTDPGNAWSLFPVDQATNQAGVSPNTYEFFRSLKVCALSLLESDGSNNGTRIAGTQIGGWDLHSGQVVVGNPTVGAHAGLLQAIGYGYRSLHMVLSGAANDPRNYPAIWDKTAVITMSEFGRTTEQNGSFGTDHAAASCMFLAGGTVNGGVYNCDATTWPDGVMFGVDGRYLLERTDYRPIFWEVLRDHMGASSTGVDSIFPSYTSLALGSQELGLIGS